MREATWLKVAALAAVGAIVACSGSTGDGGVTDDGADSGSSSGSASGSGSGGTSESGALDAGGSSEARADGAVHDAHGGAQPDASLALDAGSPDATSTLPPTTTCAMAAGCGNSGQNFQQCTTSSGSTCDGVAYETTGGTSFPCASCNDCSAAFDDLMSYCSSLVLTCGTSYECGSSGFYSYEMCTDSLNGVCTYAWYESTSAARYPCASCSDCSAAATEMTNYCDGM